MRRDAVHVLFDDAAGDADEFGVGAVIEEKIVAEVLEILLAVEAVAARGGIAGHDAVTLAPGKRVRIHIAGLLNAPVDDNRQRHALFLALIIPMIPSATAHGKSEAAAAPRTRARWSNAFVTTSTSSRASARWNSWRDT